MNFTLTPAYGRDYKSKAAIREDLLAGKDFTIADIGSRWWGKPINLSQMREAGAEMIQVRYSCLRKVTVIKMEELDSE